MTEIDHDTPNLNQIAPHELHPSYSPKAQEALSRAQGNATVMIYPISSGGIAIFGRDFRLHAIIEDNELTAEKIREFSITLEQKIKQKLKFNAESRFYGEPNDKQFARDLRQKEPKFRPVPLILDLKF